nr:DNA-binding protein HEXBP-like [Halyomorpha halys]
MEDGTEYRTTAQGIHQQHGREENPGIVVKIEARIEKGGRDQGRIRNGGGKEDWKCHGCGKVGHLVDQCPRTRCFECGNEGHIARQCPYMYRRARKINFQRIRRKRREDYRPSESSSETSEASGTEGGGRGGGTINRQAVDGAE